MATCCSLACTQARENWEGGAQARFLHQLPHPSLAPAPGLTENAYIRVTVKEQVFHAMQTFSHGQSKTFSPDPGLELELELEVDPGLEVGVPEDTGFKDESEAMSFTRNNWSTVFELGASFGSVPLFCICVLELHVAHHLPFADTFWHDKHWQRHILGHAHNARF